LASTSSSRVWRVRSGPRSRSKKPVIMRNSSRVCRWLRDTSSTLTSCANSAYASLSTATTVDFPAWT
jgi:hypothetical protein